MTLQLSRLNLRRSGGGFSRATLRCLDDGLGILARRGHFCRRHELRFVKNNLFGDVRGFRDLRRFDFFCCFCRVGCVDPAGSFGGVSGFRGLRSFSFARRAFRGFLDAPALAPVIDVRRWNRRRHDARPVERDAKLPYAARRVVAPIHPPPPLSRRVAAAILGAHYAVIRRAAHNPMDERPREFNAVLLEFLGLQSKNDKLTS
jgi:pimeloyl-ACP methyl ester carboxylesterase